MPGKKTLPMYTGVLRSLDPRTRKSVRGEKSVTEKSLTGDDFPAGAALLKDEFLSEKLCAHPVPECHRRGDDAAFVGPPGINAPD
jgi:hypothetical protein